ncbi:MAG: RidA family protein [Flavobacteriales bacterium]|nr:RidA family protein [Flavobacteriales bacterium]
MEIQRISSGAYWETKVGYSRLVRYGDVIEISGTVAMGPDGVIGVGDVHAQASFILTGFKKLLEENGSSLDRTIRTRLFTTDIALWEEIGRAHHDFFGEIKPVTTLVEVSKLIHRDLLIEIELTALANSFPV